MIVHPASGARHFETRDLIADLAIVGGGIAGVCAAITAAREGIRVVLIQDRPVLGGNASSEVRLWILGATSHMGNNNRWSREGGVIDELLVENLWRNPEGNALMLDALLLEKVIAEPRITLLLNTAVDAVDLNADGSIRALKAFCSQNSTRYEVAAPLFCDASGDGVVGFLAGAAFRIGAESREEFGELSAPDASFGELLGHSLYFYTRDTGRPVRYIAPAFALKNIDAIPRYRDFKTSDYGCRLWWLEYGGRLDTVHETEAIKWELWRIAYGVWDYIKNSGKFPEAETLTLEWMGTIPGKRESRRFEGDYMVRQQDIVGQTQFDDAVSFGGWAMDLHPADGIYSEQAPCVQWHSKGVYQIPYRSLYSRNVPNLFLAGRTISATHLAFGSTRVMATCGHNAQAVGVAAALCATQQLRPRDLTAPALMQELQTRLLASGQWIPGLTLHDPRDLATSARIEASSTLAWQGLPPNGTTVPLNTARALLLPLPAGAVPSFTFSIDATRPTLLQAELRTSPRRGNYTPEQLLSEASISVAAGKAQPATLPFDTQLPEADYAFIVLRPNPHLHVHVSDQLLTGITTVSQAMNAAVAKSARQSPPAGIGVDSFDFWLPERRPHGKNLAVSLQPPLQIFPATSLANGVLRPWLKPNAWVADPEDPNPCVRITWPEPQTIATIVLSFDTDFDHPMESVLMGHPETAMPFCVRSYRILDNAGKLLAHVTENHQTRNTLRFDPPITTAALHLEIDSTHGAPAALFGVQCYAP